MLLEFVLVSETDLGERSSTARVVDNILHNSLDVSVSKKKEKHKVRHSLIWWCKNLSTKSNLPSALCEVQSSEAGRGDSL